MVMGCNKWTTLVQDFDSKGETVSMWGRVYMNSPLYFKLNFAVNLTLLFKIVFLKIVPLRIQKNIQIWEPLNSLVHCLEQRHLHLHTLLSVTVCFLCHFGKFTVLAKPVPLLGSTSVQKLSLYGIVTSNHCV